MKSDLSLIATAAALIVTGFGCGASTVAPVGCAQTVDVVVSNETTPLFSWTPPCGVSYLGVETVPPTGNGIPETFWSFSVPENQPVGPWIRYGQAPARAHIGVAAKPLVAGNYRITVVQTVGGDVLEGGGEALFTR
jgi:hypothetical protein